MKRQEGVDWAERTRQVEKWRQSGLSVRAYCVREGLEFERFDYWRKEVWRRAPRGKLVPQDRGGFVPVAVVSSAVSTKSGDVVLTSPGGWQVRLPLEAESLLTVLRQLP